MNASDYKLSFYNPDPENNVKITDIPLDQAFVESFRLLQDVAGRCEDAHGFRDYTFNFGEKVALMHAELSEALEYFRKGNGTSDHIQTFSGVEEEFADVIIRIMGTAEMLGLKVAEAVIAKMAFNETRPYKHGGKKF